MRQPLTAYTALQLSAEIWAKLTITGAHKKPAWAAQSYLFGCPVCEFQRQKHGGVDGGNMCIDCAIDWSTPFTSDINKQDRTHSYSFCHHSYDHWLHVARTASFSYGITKDLKRLASYVLRDILTSIKNIQRANGF